MYSIRKLRSSIQIHKCLRGGKNAYHSYPDPNEVAVITRGKAMQSIVDDQGKVLPKINKNNDSFKVGSNYNLLTSFPGIPSSKGISSHNSEISLTTCKNGLKVVSQELPSLMTSVAFIVGSGSSNEIQDTTKSNYTLGATHALELTAFGSTTNRDQLVVQQEMEKLGGMMQCIANRESILYCVDVLRENVDEAVEIVADTILNPLYTENTEETYRNIMSYQQNELPTAWISRDALQLVAYQKNSPLGYLHYIPEDKIPFVNNNCLQRFREKYFVAENCVVSGVGIEHEHLLQLADKHFKSLVSIGQDKHKALLNEKKKSVYTGGFFVEKRQLKESEFTRLAISFEIGGWQDKDFVAYCVMQQLLGGGSSFSAGGPGKGMYTRLYTDVLNCYGWVESAEAFMTVHNDSGIFGIDGSCNAEYASHLLRAFLDQLVRLSIEPISDIELDRAKNMLRSMMMLQLESRLVVCEDIARQISAFGFRESPHEMALKIEAVTKNDLQRIASNLFNSKPTIVGLGEDITHIPTYKDIQAFLKEYLETIRSANKWIHI